MRIMTVTLALGATLALSTAAHAQRHHRVRPVPAATAADPFWVPDYYVVPRYRYRPQDDRVETSPYARPVASSYPQLGGIGFGQ